MSDTYYRGTPAEFNAWHTWAKEQAGIPAEGIINYVKGQLAPDKQKTVAVSDQIINPDNANDVVWFYGEYPKGGYTTIPKQNAIDLGFFPAIKVIE